MTELSISKKGQEYRQHVASLALVALIQKHPQEIVVGEEPFRQIAAWAVAYADHLIAALESDRGNS